MAKRASRKSDGKSGTAQVPAGTAAHGKLEEFAEDLGAMLGSAQNKAQSWLGQRQAIVQNLTQLRDTATKLLADLGHEAQAVLTRGRKPKVVYATPPISRKKKRKMSPEARKAISDAQKARWAKQKAATKK